MCGVEKKKETWETREVNGAVVKHMEEDEHQRQWTKSRERES